MLGVGWRRKGTLRSGAVSRVVVSGFCFAGGVRVVARGAGLRGILTAAVSKTPAFWSGCWFFLPLARVDFWWGKGVGRGLEWKGESMALVSVSNKYRRVIREARRKLGLSQGALEKSSKLGKTYVWYVESGKTQSTNPAQLTRLLKALHRQADKAKASTKLKANLFKVLSGIEKQRGAARKAVPGRKEARAAEGLETIPKERLTIRVYLSKSDPSLENRIVDAIQNLAEAYRFKTEDSPPEKGSWFREWILKSLDKKEVVERLEKLERTVEVATLQTYQAAVNKTQAEAATLLIKEIAGVPNAVCQVGSILTIKRTLENGREVLIVRTLSPREMILIERNPHLLQNPDSFLVALSNHSKLSLPETGNKSR